MGKYLTVMNSQSKGILRHIFPAHNICTVFPAVFFVLLLCPPLFAMWIWTPENGWMNEKNIVKASPMDQMEYADGFVKEGKYDKAIYAYRSLIKAYPASPLAAKAQEKTAECYRKNGMLYKSFLAYQKLLENYPKDIDIDDVLGEQFRIGELFIKGKKSRLWRLPIMPARDKGIEIMEIIIKNAPFSKTAPKAQFELATAYKRQKKYTKAVSAYQKIITDYKDTEWYKEALYQAGWCNYKKSHGFSYDQPAAKEAETLLRRFLKEFPDTGHTRKVKKLLGELSERQVKGLMKIARFYEKQGHKKAALMYYSEIIEKAPDTEEAKKAKERQSILKGK